MVVKKRKIMNKLTKKLGNIRVSPQRDSLERIYLSVNEDKS